MILASKSIDGIDTFEKKIEAIDELINIVNAILNDYNLTNN